jgi:hypothetical protein
MMTTDKLERSNRRLDAAAAAAPDNPAGAGGAKREDAHATHAARQQYAAELAAHFQAYVDWAIDHWPADEKPLEQAAFAASREDLNALCCQAGASTEGDADPGEPGVAQFVPVAPMPWP